MKDALTFSKALKHTIKKIETLSGDTTVDQRNQILAQMNKQDCKPGWPAYFLVAKAGVAEDSWTPT